MARILLVDDNESNRFAVVETIRKLTDCVVDEVSDGLATLEHVRRHQYDLVLLDVQMPGIDGFEVCRRLRSDPNTRRLPVLFLTAASHNLEDRIRGLDLGADDFIVQPVSNQELVARIRAALRVKALTDEIQRANAALESKVRERSQTADQLTSALRAERDTLRETFDVFEDGLLLFDEAGNVLVANSAGQRLHETISATDLRALSDEATRGGAACRTLVNHAGRSFAVRAYAVSGRRALLALRDVTDERHDEMRRLQAEKLASIGMLAAGVAHEINNPAAFVLGNIEALGNQMRLIEERVRASSSPQATHLEPLEPILFEAKVILQESKEGMARIQRIVRDLSSFSHKDEAATATATSVNAAVESTLSMLRVELRHRATVTRDLRATHLVHADPARLGQVFLNLIMNAAQAMEERDPKQNRIVIRTHDNGEKVIFEVTDNGPGIAPDVRARIFDSFFTTKPRGVGTGLGLSISQGIVRSMGGEIQLESQPGQGATFRVILPVTHRSPVEAAPPETPPPTYQRRRILAVDDEALLLKAYRRMLSETHEVMTALGGKDALRILDKETDFDLVLCDLQMPEMSGMELYEIVQKRDPALAQKFVFVTGGAYSAEAKAFLEQSVFSINKPFNIDELLLVIEQRAALTSSAPADHQGGGFEADVVQTRGGRPVHNAVAMSASAGGGPKRLQ